jgi:CMP-N-acetylneuraminic acid synthetase
LGKNLIKNSLNKLTPIKHWTMGIELFSVQNFRGEVVDGFWITDCAEKTRSQELPQKYVPSGRFFAFNCKNTIELNEAYGNRVVPFFTEEWKNINIDNPTDIEKMKFIYDRYTSDYSHLIE